MRVPIHQVLLSFLFVQSLHPASNPNPPMARGEHGQTGDWTDVGTMMKRKILRSARHLFVLGVVLGGLCFALTLGVLAMRDRGWISDPGPVMTAWTVVNAALFLLVVICLASALFQFLRGAFRAH